MTTTERFVALELLEPMADSIFEPWRFRCQCGMCGGEIIYVDTVQLLMTKHYRLLIGDFQDLAIVTTDKTHTSSERKPNGEYIKCICVLTSDLPTRRKE